MARMVNAGNEIDFGLLSDKAQTGSNPRASSAIAPGYINSNALVPNVKLGDRAVNATVDGVNAPTAWMTVLAASKPSIGTCRSLIAAVQKRKCSRISPTLQLLTF